MDKMTFDKHTSAQFNAELEDARKHLMEMGGLVEQQIETAFKSLMEVDTDLATRAIEKDKDVNKMEITIDKQTTQILAKRNPAASDLRFIISVTKTVNELERIGDEAAKIAKQAIELADTGSGPQGYVELRHIGEKVRQMVQSALDSFARLDAEAALSVMQQDKAVDLEYGTAIRSLVTTMMEDPRSISRALNVMWALRSLERIGDHARNIAEQVIYLVKGKDVRHKKLEKVAEQVKK
ncbi:phosphate signaling complex protein PhoU [Reinekea blandensis]|uniref:Phosphate-specific transport system accessory protein PhoU n=1 Tax=Reinekea blandensis MED297 TaxID=314283 RepID=A4BF26_9GAMM|nr:phosphate signaling complex protein PhoU [Reinekea blandensis]EAR09361.1 phosphate transport system protein PhoU [Reinekea sp. MED297] [Reinekea blandensis MED297]